MAVLNEQNESKYFSTAFLFDEALIYLLEKKELKYITVKEICDKAGVNGSTFYLHYESIEDLVNETMRYVDNKFMDYFIENDFTIDNIKESDKESLYLLQDKYLIPYLSFIKDNKIIFKASLSNPKGMNADLRYSGMQEKIFNPILDKLNIPDNEREYMLNFYIYGILAIIKTWVLNNCNDSIEDISKIISKCIKNND